VTGALLAAPLGAEAQQAGKSYRVCFVALTPGEDTTSMKPLLERLRELGYIEGKNMTFEYQSAEGHSERLPELAMASPRSPRPTEVWVLSGCAFQVPHPEGLHLRVIPGLVRVRPERPCPLNRLPTAATGLGFKRGLGRADSSRPRALAWADNRRVNETGGPALRERTGARSEEARCGSAHSICASDSFDALRRS